MARTIITIISVVVLLASPALAAEPSLEKAINPTSWTGIYVGGHLGYGWDRPFGLALARRRRSSIIFRERALRHIALVECSAAAT